MYNGYHQYYERFGKAQSVKMRFSCRNFHDRLLPVDIIDVGREIYERIAVLYSVQNIVAQSVMVFVQHRTNFSSDECETTELHLNFSSQLHKYEFSICAKNIPQLEDFAKAKPAGAAVKNDRETVDVSRFRAGR